MDEVTLVKCDVEARRGVPFSIRLTDRQLIWERPVSFKMKPTETTVFRVSDITAAHLVRKSPWPLRLWGVVCVFVAVSSFALSATTSERPRPILTLTAATMGFAAFASAKNRYELTFRAGGAFHRLPQPWCWSSVTRATMTTALHHIAELLEDPVKREKAIDAEREPESEPPERRVQRRARRA